jgi:DNA-directed RNA polymerase subunit M/transcription elongation factor TFIIS
MESAAITPTAHEIADLVVQRLLEGGGIKDLANANLLMIEEQTIEEVDRVTRLVMSELLAKQSQEAQPVTKCPKCDREMTPKKAQHRSLQSRRGDVEFMTEVSHCEACRLDFFPSDENIAV